MVELLLNPKGRIPGGPPIQGPFWQGVLILLGAGIVLNLLVLVSPTAIKMIWSLLGLALFYAWVCVYVKRFHDNGKTGWYVAAVIVVMILVNMLAVTVLLPIMGSVVVASLLSLVIYIAVSLGIAYYVATLPSDPGENQYGPATGGAAPVA